MNKFIVKYRQRSWDWVLYDKSILLPLYHGHQGEFYNTYINLSVLWSSQTRMIQRNESWFNFTPKRSRLNRQTGWGSKSALNLSSQQTIPIQSFLQFAYLSRQVEEETTQTALAWGDNNPIGADFKSFRSKELFFFCFIDIRSQWRKKLQAHSWCESRFCLQGWFLMWSSANLWTERSAYLAD